mgnify:CR=1 FL=1
MQESLECRQLAGGAGARACRGLGRDARGRPCAEGRGGAGRAQEGPGGHGGVGEAALASQQEAERQKALELKAEQGDFDGVRKHVPQPADFVVKGRSEVFSDFTGRSSFECWLTFSHTGAKGEVKSESILVDVTPSPGAPSEMSELREATSAQTM